jgi:hypothetical protein
MEGNMSEDFMMLLIVLTMFLLVIVMHVWWLVRFLAAWLYYRVALWGANRFYKSPYDKEDT